MANSNVKFGLKPIGVVGGVAGTTGATPVFHQVRRVCNVSGFTGYCY